MKETNMTTELYCLRCQSDTPHRLTYLNSTISKIKCLQCSRTHRVHVNVKNELYHELLERIKTKPIRVTKEYRKNMTLFLKIFPRRVVNKPFRLYKEAKEMKTLIEKYSKRH